MSDSPDIKPEFIDPGNRYTFAAWRVGLAGGALTALFALLHGFVPAFREVSLFLFPAFRTVYVLIPFSALALAWSVAGLVRRRRDGHGLEAGFGAVLAAAALLMAIFASSD